MMIIYNILYFFFVIFSIPVLLLEGKWHPGFNMRLGVWPHAVQQELKSKENIWIHAVSVGEIFAVQGVIKELTAAFPKFAIVVSTVTKTGYQLAAHKFEDATVIYAPLDFGFSVERYIHFIKPKIYISAETEIWPNLFLALSRHRTNIVLVNGRISERSMRRYKLIKGFLKPILDAVTRFCMQTSADAQRLKELGVVSEKTSVVGNMKFDDQLDDIPARLKAADWLAKELLWVAGSTHPGEEAIILRVFKRLQPAFKPLRLLIAPRHIERVGELTELVRSFGLIPRPFSTFNAVQLADYEVMIIDTIGDLRYLYGSASVVFVGKSLVGQGGQNILEPAFFSKPIIVGPNMQNFKDVKDIFKDHAALEEVQDEEGLYQAMNSLLSDPGRRARLGHAAHDTLMKFRGATAKTVAAVSPFLSA